jgi:hypothetical protein
MFSRRGSASVKAPRDVRLRKTDKTFLGAPLSYSFSPRSSIELFCRWSFQPVINWGRPDVTGCGPLEIQRKAEAGAPGNSRARRRQHNDQSRAASVSCNALTNRPRGASFSAKRGRACPRAKTRGWPKAGWGAEGRHGPMKVRNDGRSIRLGPKQRTTPHPALRATFPSKWGRGALPPPVTRRRTAPGAPPSPRSGEGGRRPDGVRKAGMVRRRFAMTVAQSDSGRSSGPHPIRPFGPPSRRRAKAGNGDRPKAGGGGGSHDMAIRLKNSVLQARGCRRPRARAD